MDLRQLLWFLLIGLAAGWLAGRIMKGKGFGVLGDMVVGVIGAFVGGWVFGLLGLAAGGLLGRLVRAHLHECEAARTAGFPIHHHLDLGDLCTIGTKDLPEIDLGN